MLSHHWTAYTITLTSSALSAGSSATGDFSLRTNGLDYCFVQLAIGCGTTSSTVHASILPGCSLGSPWDSAAEAIVDGVSITGATSATVYRTWPTAANHPAKIEYADFRIKVTNNGGTDLTSLTCVVVGHERIF